MIKRVAPAGTIIHNSYFEYREGNTLLLRPLGTYPLLCFTPAGETQFKVTDVAVVDHGPRSVSVLPYPFLPNKATLAQWKSIPGIGAKRAASLKAAHPLANVTEVENILDMPLPTWLSRIFSFKED
jgi:radical SAM superfamily enzyme with C-terminal helix-hairpin-helix motif